MNRAQLERLIRASGDIADDDAANASVVRGAESGKRSRSTIWAGRLLGGDQRSGGNRFSCRS